MIPSAQNRLKIENRELKKDLPSDPGVYLFRDSSERVIYVGKAKNLKNRVSSYFNSPSEMTPKTVMMVSREGELCGLIAVSDTLKPESAVHTLALVLAGYLAGQFALTLSQGGLVGETFYYLRIFLAISACSGAVHG